MIRAAALSLLLVAQAAAAAPVAGPRLGERIKIGDETFVPNTVLHLHPGQKPQPGIYRNIAVDWHDRPHAGDYPAAAFAAKQEGEVSLSLTVAADGKPTACRISEPSGIAALDEHSCGHVLAQRGFHPGLDDKGGRFGGTVEGTLSYNLHLVLRTTLIEDMGWNWLSRPPAPQQPITLDTLGIPRGVELHPEIKAIKALLATDARGSVTACLLTWPTFEDTLDKGACDRLRKQRFHPAMDRQQRPVASLYGVDLPLPR
ncbi:MAG TPA: TonB family protein [Allosphingosinicella sp.]|nr:TonB family protein [Allosphingosinicella sp.]